MNGFEVLNRIIYEMRRKGGENVKRRFCVLLAVLMLLPVFAVTAFAHGHGHSGNSHGHAAVHHPVNNQHCTDKKSAAGSGICPDKCEYADENKDNICDNCGNRCGNCGETKDENADGICDSCGKCSHYRDTDGDGICDHQEEPEKTPPAKPIKKHGHYGGKHKCHY